MPLYLIERQFAEQLDLSAAGAAQIKLVSGVKEMRQQETVVPGGRTLHLSYRTRSNAVVHQYFVKHDELLYVLTYVVGTTDLAKDKQARNRRRKRLRPPRPRSTCVHRPLTLRFSFAKRNWLRKWNRCLSNIPKISPK